MLFNKNFTKHLKMKKKEKITIIENSVLILIDTNAQKIIIEEIKLNCGKANRGQGNIVFQRISVKITWTCWMCYGNVGCVMSIFRDGVVVSIQAISFHVDKHSKVVHVPAK